MSGKVLRIITRLNVGGPTKHVAWLTAGLAQKNWVNVLITGNVEADEDNMEDFVTRHGVEVRYLPSLKRSISPREDVAAVMAIYNLLCDSRPDIVHTHMSKAGLVGRTAVLLYNLSHRHKIKTVHTFHGHTFHGYFSPSKEKLFLWIERTLARFATDVIIAISPQQKSELLDVYKVGHYSQYRQINLGIDTSFVSRIDRSSLRKKLQISPESKVFGIVGRIAEIKNHRLFIDSVRSFFKRHPGKDVCFLIVGDGDRAFVDELKRYAEGLDRLYFAGNVTDPACFYGALDYLVLTSKNEGTPVSILEAFACGIPVLATRVGGVVDLVGQNERGRLISAEADEIADDFAALLQNDVTESVNRAKEHVYRNYSVDELVNKIHSLYNQLI